MSLEKFLKRVALIGAFSVSGFLGCDVLPQPNNLNSNNNQNLNSNNNQNLNSNNNQNLNSNNNQNLNSNSGGDFFREGELIVSNGFRPNLSPNGQKIAFMRLHLNDNSDPYNGQTDIWMIGINGNGLKRVTNTLEDEFHPKWTPDGNYLVFGRTDGDYFSQDSGKLFATDSNGNNEFQFFVNNFEDVKVKDFCFYNGNDAGSQVGEEPKRMRNTLYRGEDDSIWLTLGDYYNVSIASTLKSEKRFFNLSSRGQSDYIITNDPSWRKIVLFEPLSLKEKTIQGNYDFPIPALSPNGQKIIAGTDGGLDHGLYVMNVDGSNLQRVTDKKDLAPSWDGKTVVYTRINKNAIIESFEFGDLYKISLNE